MKKTEAKFNLIRCRVLDSKRSATQRVTAQAPPIEEFLDGEAKHILDGFKKDSTLNIPFTIEPKLVRGVGYYTHTTFEFQSQALESAQTQFVEVAATTG